MHACAARQPLALRSTTDVQLCPACSCAPMAYVLWKETMKLNPKNPYWFNRDRFVLSAGHGSMLQYSLLYLAGFDSVGVRCAHCIHMHEAHHDLWMVNMPTTYVC